MWIHCSLRFVRFGDEALFDGVQAVFLTRFVAWQRFVKKHIVGLQCLDYGVLLVFPFRPDCMKTRRWGMTPACRLASHDVTRMYRHYHLSRNIINHRENILNNVNHYPAFSILIKHESPKLVRFHILLGCSGADGSWLACLVGLHVHMTFLHLHMQMLLFLFFTSCLIQVILFSSFTCVLCTSLFNTLSLPKHARILLLVVGFPLLSCHGVYPTTKRSIHWGH